MMSPVTTIGAAVAAVLLQLPIRTWSRFWRTYDLEIYVPGPRTP